MEWTFTFTEEWEFGKTFFFSVKSNDFEEAKNEAEKKINEKTESSRWEDWTMTSAEVVFDD